MAWQIRDQLEKHQAADKDSKKEMYSNDMRVDDERREWEEQAQQEITGTGPITQNTHHTSS